MGYYCTVPQCTSLAGKTKNVKFHRFPRDVDMANKWNNILKRGKPYTKYSKVCSLHFTQADYNVTTMGQWKTLSKDAIPSQNLPRLNPDGSVMVIRKSRTVKREIKREGSVDRELKFSPPGSAHLSSMDAMSGADAQDGHQLAYRFHSLNALANVISPHHAANQTQPPLSTIAHPTTKPKKQDAIMQTDPIQDEADLNNSYASDNEEAKSFESEIERYQGQYQKDYKEGEQEQPPPPTYQQQENSKMADLPKDYTKSHDDYIPQTNDEYNKEAERYALDRKRTNYHPKNDYQKHHFDKTDYPKLYEKVNHESYGKMDEGYHSKHVDYQKSEGFKGHSDFSKGENGLQKNDYGGMVYGDKEFQRDGYITYQNGYPDAADLLRSQQHSLQMLQEQHRITENQNFFTESHIKQENDLAMDDDKYAYERAKEQIELAGRRGARLMDHLQHTLKQEPDLSVQPHGSPYYPANAHSNVPGGYYEGGLPRPGPELLIAKQNALAAHTQLWQNTMKRPFYYSESPHYTGTPTLLHRYEDLSRILQ